jgi:hypothetical protein
LDVTDFDLWQSTDLSDEPNWAEVPGSYVDGFVMELDPLVEWYYLDTQDVQSTTPLADGLYPFYLDVTELPDGFDAYWAGEGVTADAEQDTWQAEMYLIVTGEAPMFYLSVDSTSGTPVYMLVDGLQYGMASETQEYLRINGDFPLGAYSFYHTVDDLPGSER